MTHKTTDTHKKSRCLKICIVKKEYIADVLFTENMPMDIVKNKLVDEVPYIGKEFSVSFELLINKFQPAVEYTSVLHLTTGDNYGKMGDRIPALWVTKENLLYVAHAISGNHNNLKLLPGLKEKLWNKVEISQKLVNGKVKHGSS